MYIEGVTDHRIVYNNWWWNTEVCTTIDDETQKCAQQLMMKHKCVQQLMMKYACTKKYLLSTLFFSFPFQEVGVGMGGRGAQCEPSYVQDCLLCGIRVCWILGIYKLVYDVCKCLGQAGTLFCSWIVVFLVRVLVLIFCRYTLFVVWKVISSLQIFVLSMLQWRCSSFEKYYLYSGDEETYFKSEAGQFSLKYAFLLCVCRFFGLFLFFTIIFGKYCECLSPPPPSTLLSSLECHAWQGTELIQARNADVMSVMGLR